MAPASKTCFVEPYAAVSKDRKARRMDAFTSSLSWAFALDIHPGALQTELRIRLGHGAMLNAVVDCNQRNSRGGSSVPV